MGALILLIWHCISQIAKQNLQIMKLNNLVQLPRQTAVQYRKSGGIGK